MITAHAATLSSLNQELDLHLQQKVDYILRAAVQFRVTLLPAEALHLGEVMPWTPSRANASLTSSSLNGLITASIFLMAVLPIQPRQPPCSVSTMHGRLPELSYRSYSMIFLPVWSTKSG